MLFSCGGEQDEREESEVKIEEERGKEARNKECTFLPRYQGRCKGTVSDKAPLIK